ncbi:hypothetical protein CIG19_02865 [Enterobacterales bacterium CwR94]|nr:hypothetical protein CIG19_02865 [Enterobacterales bacterium CwR94]
MRSLLLCLPLIAAPALAAQDITLQRYIVTFPQHQRVSYQGLFTQNFPQGFPVGIGSGITFTGMDNGVMTFATVTDRGPNADAPEVDGKEGKIFAAPDFTPMLMILRVGANDAQATEARPLQDNGLRISGLPLPGGQVGSTGEIPLNDRLERLRFDKRGLDPEGITPDGAGGYWLADEYGPFLVHIDTAGNILTRKGPQATQGQQTEAGGLPTLLQWRQPNRGFEGVTRLPDGRIIAAVQSTLDIEGKTRNTSPVIRLLSYDPASGATKMYAYPIDSNQYVKNSDAKIGDLTTLDNRHVLLIEQGKDPAGKMHNRIIQVDIGDASDLTAFDENPVEFGDLAAMLDRGVRPVKKRQIVDLADVGWRHEKAEGLTLVDATTLVVTNDNDFGLQGDLIAPVAAAKKITQYQLGNQALLYQQQPVKTRLQLSPLPAEEALSALWVLHLPQPLPL